MTFILSIVPLIDMLTIIMLIVFNAEFSVFYSKAEFVLCFFILSVVSFIVMLTAVVSFIVMLTVTMLIVLRIVLLC